MKTICILIQVDEGKRPLSDVRGLAARLAILCDNELSFGRQTTIETWRSPHAIVLKSKLTLALKPLLEMEAP